MDPEDLLNSLIRLMGIRRATSVYLNGAPGSGKTSLLRQIKIEFPKENPNSYVFGPYSTGSIIDFTNVLLKDCRDTALIEDGPQREGSMDLLGTFVWLKENLQTTERQTVLILVDLEDAGLDVDGLRCWFSSIRSLEEKWEGGPCKLVVVITGFWDPNQLEEHYAKIRLSFPYTIGHNYYPWDGIPVRQMEELIADRFPKRTSPVPFGRLLHEITDGHPGAAVDILTAIPNGKELSIASILAAVKRAASGGTMAQELVQIWSRLPDKTLAVIRRMLLLQQIPEQNLRLYFDQLRSAGLIKGKFIGGGSYGVLRSWYVECTLRYHQESLGLTDPDLNRAVIDELVPHIISVNREAYDIVVGIEDLVKNFAVVRLSSRTPSGESVLQNRAFKFDKDRNDKLSAEERALEWREASKRALLCVEINPLVAYLPINHLPALVKDVARVLGSEKWEDIADTIDKVDDIRNAVMHGQMIDDDSFKRLYNLRAQIYEALRPQS